MEALDQRAGLFWLIRVRMLMIVFVFSIQFAVTKLASSPTPVNWFTGMCVLWFAVTVFYTLLLRMWTDYTTQALVQILFDALMVTAVVHLSGGTESHFIFLYPLVVIVAGISLPRPHPYVVASLSFIFYGATLELAYYEKIPAFWKVIPDPRLMQVTIFTSLASFILVAYLSHTLADSMRKTGAKLTKTSGELETLQAFNQNVLDSIIAGVLTTDLEGRVQLLNRAGEAILEPNGSLFSRRLDVAVPGLGAVRSLREEVRVVTPAGKEKILGVTMSPLTSSDGRPMGSVYFMQDLTEIKRLEQELQMQDRMAALGRMGAAIAHEIRNPLASIAGSARVFSSLSELTEDQRRLVDIVRRESERLDRILTDFLNYSRQRKYEFQSANLGALLEETLTLISHRPDADNWKLEFKLPTSPVTAQADVDAIKQVFWNLCDNALKAMSEGGTLSVEVFESGQRAVILFQDTGCGIHPRQADKVFEPFQSDFRAGTGLGLAIVYEIINAHQGTVSAEPRPGGGGTTFRLTLPLDRRETVARQPEARSVVN